MEPQELTLYRNGNQTIQQVLDEASGRYGREYVSTCLHRLFGDGKYLSLTRLLIDPEAVRSADVARLEAILARFDDAEGTSVDVEADDETFGGARGDQWEVDGSGTTHRYAESLNVMSADPACPIPILLGLPLTMMFSYQLIRICGAVGLDESAAHDAYVSLNNLRQTDTSGMLTWQAMSDRGVPTGGIAPVTFPEEWLSFDDDPEPT